jgi:hypothetical protein
MGEGENGRRGEWDKGRKREIEKKSVKQLVTEH